jgi:dethiobiotin synthetase
MARPDRLIVVAGTGTEVGKTWVAGALLGELRRRGRRGRRGRRVAARKPAQSFEPGATAGPTDAEVLGAATGEPAEVVCPPHRWYEVAMAPPMAAEVLGRPAFTISDLVAELAWPDPAPDVGLIETAGGVRSPLASDGDTVDLVVALRPGPDAVVLVADAGLGTLNLVRISADALAGAGAGGGPPVIVYLNRYDGDLDLHRRNREWIDHRIGLATATTPAELIESLGLHNPSGPVGRIQP